MSADVTAALAAVTGALPAAEERPGQRQMAQAVASSIDSGRLCAYGAGRPISRSTAARMVLVIVSSRAAPARDQSPARHKYFTSR